MSYWLYILRLQSRGLYIGQTKDLNQRYKEHCSGQASRTTKLDSPIGIVYREKYQTLIEARKRETQIKKWSKAKKEALIAGDTAKLKGLAKSRQYRKKD